VTSAVRWALIHELRGGKELALEDALRKLSPCDLALVEGFKAAAIPKLEVYRASIGKPLLHRGDGNIVAVASDAPVETTLPLFDVGNIAAIAGFILKAASVAWP
jgi:molybdopterin-guanine dinucleotide biosynthesis protein B